MSLIGKKCKIKFNNYKPEEMNQAFTEFLYKNRDNIFTIDQEEKYKGGDIYILAEDPRWLFHVVNLEVIK